MKILYVEDNDDNIYMLQRRLTRAGFGRCAAAQARRPAKHHEVDQRV